MLNSPTTKVDIYLSFERNLINILSHQKLDPTSYINVLDVLISLNQTIRKLKIEQKYNSQQTNQI